MSVARIALGALLLWMAWPSSSLAGNASTKPAWTALAQVYAEVHGKWKPTRTVASLSELRCQMTVRGAELNSKGLRATIAIMHLSWQGSRKVIMPPTVVVRLRTEMISKHTEVFEGTATVPTILPVFWSVIRFVASDGQSRVEASSGVMVGAPAKRTPNNTFTVPEANKFCVARSRLQFLRYAIFLRGYFKTLITRGDGPGAGVILDRPRRINPAFSPGVSYPNGIITSGFSFPRGNTWITRAGFLDRSSGRADYFSMDIGR
jgi:hypothetical protein